MMRGVIKLMVLSLCILTCKHPSDEHTVYQFPEVTQLEGNPVGPINFILRPFRMTKIGSYLVINDPVPNKATNCLLYLYCTITDTVAKNFGNYGDGPGELKNVSDFHVNEEKNEIVVYDQTRKNFLHFNIDSLLTAPKYMPRVVPAPLGLFSLYRFCMPNDTLYVTNGEEKLFTFFSGKGNVTIEKKDYPIADRPVRGFETNIKGDRLRSLLVGQLAFDHIRSNIIIAYLNFDLIEIYTLDGELQGYVKNPTHYAPYVNKGWYNYHFCYYDVKVVGNYIYALYSGYKLERGKDDWKQGKTIQVFDKDLNPIRKYELDTPISSFEIDSVNNKIYAINSNSEQPITVFDF
jgi:hypothetical protein